MEVKFLSATIIVFSTIVYASSVSLIDKKLENTYGPTITDGNCDSTPDKELVDSVNVKKNAIPFFERSDTVTYYGDKKIYCIKVLNLRTDHFGHANITAGGVEHSFATILMESDTSHGMEFHIYIYAN